MIQQRQRPRVIFFVFGGREANLRLALPFYERILAEHQDVEIHLWDLARDRAVSKYMRSISSLGIDRLKVRTEFYEATGKASHGQIRTWKHYARAEYRNCLFVKADDDCIFYDTDHFSDFIDAIRPDDVLSALVINNGASSSHIPGIWDMYQNLDIPLEVTARTPELQKLLNVHKSPEYAELSHRWFFDNWKSLVAVTGRVVDTEDWVSINCIGMTWETLVSIAARLWTRSPREIAGRHYTARNRLGDEGSVNMLPRRIHTGFTVAHLSFGPQHEQLPDATLTELRKLYADIATQYL